MRFIGIHIAFFLVLANLSQAQTLIAVQDFETSPATPTLTISSGSPTYITGSSSAADRPAATPFYSAGARAWGETNVTRTVTFSNQSLSGFTNCYVEFKLSSFSISSTTNGADAADIVTTEISVDGGTTYYSTVRVLGNSNAFWAYSATGSATTTYDGNATPVDFAPAGGGSRIADGYSTVRVDIPVSETQVRVRITMINNAAGEKWCLDNVSIFGTTSCTPPPAPSTPTAAANPSCGATTLNAITPASGETWYWQGTNPSGTSTANPSTSAYLVSTSGTYYLRSQDNATLCWSASSSSIVMTINSSPSISIHPSNATAVVGNNASFTVTATGDGLIYQWEEDQGGGFAPLSNGGIYSGTTSATLTLTGVGIGMNAWQYRAVVSGTCAPLITSNSATLTVNTGIDYRTAQSGNWATNTTWERWNGSAWVACVAGDYPNSSVSNAEIRNTHTVDQDGSGSSPFDCKNLVIQTGGVLWTNHFGSTNSYMQIYGNITCNGTVGVVTGDDICFDIAGGISCTISGTGGFYATRIRKDASINNSSNTTLTIDMNVFLFWSSASGTILYNDGSSDAMFDVVVNAGKTLRGITAGAVSNNISIDGLAGADGTNCGGSLTVYGTVDIDGTLYSTTNNINPARPVTTTIKNGGVVKCAYITSAASGAAGTTLTIESGGRLNLSGADVSSNAFSAFSNTNNTFNFNMGSTVEYSGTSAQNVESQLSYSNITFSGGGLKTLNGNTNVSGTATFTNGLVASSLSNLLLMSMTSSASGANNLSFVRGPVRKTGSSDFVFPVGKDAQYRPIAVRNLSASETFTAEYFHSDPDAVSYDVTLKDPTLYDIGRCEYWILDRTGPVVTAKVDLSWNTYSCGVDSLPALAVARWDGSIWKDEGNTATTGSPDPGTGTVSSGTVSNFSPFTLATTTVDVNPLPVELLNFTAHYNSSGQVDLNWSTASETNNDYFTIERSQDGINFGKIIIEDGAGNSSSTIQYSATDDAPLTGVSYYRLKQTDFDGSENFSQVVSVERAETDFQIVYTFHESAQGLLSIHFRCTADCSIELELYDMNGKKVYAAGKEEAVNPSEMIVPVSSLSPGIYLIKASNGKSLVTKKIKL